MCSAAAKATVSARAIAWAEEAPVALLYGGVPHVVMLATPADLEDLAVGFTMSEALVSSADEIRAFHIAGTAEQPEIHLTIAPGRFCQSVGAAKKSYRPHGLRTVRR